MIDSTTGLGIASLQLHTLVLVVDALVMNVSPGRMCGIAVPSEWHAEGGDSELSPLPAQGRGYMGGWLGA